MLSGYQSPADALAAIDAMDPEGHLDHPRFVERYHQAVTAYQDQLAEQLEKREKRARQAAAKTATEQKRRSSLHAVS